MSVNSLKYWEHVDQTTSLNLQKEKKYQVWFKKTHRKKDVSLPCYTIKHDQNDMFKVTAGYYVGVDWIDTKNTIFIAPKLNTENKEIDYIKMLFSALRHPDVSKEINELFEVKWDKEQIEIEQKQDLLTPFLVVEFLSVLKTIVRKGLKNSYYKVENNLHSRIKGKILVGKTIKQNLAQNKNLHTYCTYDEFGVNNKENRLLKKALSFVVRYLPNYAQLYDNSDLQNTYNYINPAFLNVSDKIDLFELKQAKGNSFYKEYDQAIKLGRLILKRFGFNISNTSKSTISSPPFWIDMSKLFELYTLGLLKDRFQKDILFQFSRDPGNELDFILKTPSMKMVIDTKYKKHWKDNPVHQDVRQVSGYARLKSVYNELGKKQGEIIDCLIIYPDQENGLSDLKNVNFKATTVNGYFDIFKLGIKLPVIN